MVSSAALASADVKPESESKKLTCWPLPYAAAFAFSAVPARIAVMVSCLNLNGINRIAALIWRVKLTNHEMKSAQLAPNLAIGSLT